METYTVIIIQAHEGEMPDGRLTDSVELQLMDNDPQNAIKKAKKLIKKKFYRISKVLENYVKE